jgi:hypothetical protein
MSDHNEPFDGDEELRKEKVHEENKENEEHAKQHENQNPNLGREHNPKHEGAGRR